ncbi:SusC/RagA family TonB-linked outer membrane protein [Flectobacillus rivi]|uniref:TonB-dependent receptor n=1 Tax=Flectobacillus rivi TaxID=2984209 RepID=A0ABT6Z906_9BACT|nr:TonB-dependent receptor [Flectobacillus rivi]MDI9877620.1 TonB-dependent receptor [Flectobacillus rivi]
MKKKLILQTIICILFVSVGAYAQKTDATINSTLSGTVIDEKTKEPLIGASISIKGTTHGVITDSNGEFYFRTGQKLPYVLIINYVGYESKQLVAAKPTITIELRNSSKELNEVVVVGYGTQERKNLIGSVSKINPNEVNSIPVGSIDAQLQGKVSGVQISSPTGVPGESVNVRVRGATSINADNDPLYVVDGVFINSNSLQSISTGGKSTSPIADINPNDIQSIEVLKDAEATALYGSRGANGVVLITTKRGNYEQAPQINFSASYGQAKAAKLWDLTTGPQHAQLVNEWWVNTGKDTPSLNRTFANRPFRPVSEGGRGLPEEQQTYDRLSEAFRTATLQNYDIALTGGTKSTKYYIGGGFTSQEAILKPINFTRASFKVNLDQRVSDKLTIGVNNLFTRTYRNQARAGDGPQGGLLQAALHTPTYLSPYENGVLVGRAGFDNLTLLLQNYDVNSTSLRYIGNLYFEAELLPNLKLRSSWGADYNNYNESEYWNTFLLLGAQGGLATSSITQYTTLLNEQTLTYRKRFDNGHSFGFVVGNTLQSDQLNRTYAEGRGFANNSFKIISSAATTTSTQNWSKSNLASFFAKADYSINGKYLFNASLRADGSSRFGADRKWGYFPSVGAAWRLKQEEFLKNVDLVTDLKLKASYGIVGNQNGIGNFAAQGLWTGGASYQGSAGTAPQQLANPDLRWEKTNQVNIGVDASFLAGRLGIEFNVYSKYTRDGLLQLALPSTTGFANYWSNAAEISNKGFELNITSTNINKGGLVWTTSFNIAQNINKIEKLETPLRYGSRDLILQKEGNPLYSFWVYKQLYVDPETGNVVYEDVNKDGKITTDDRQLVGSIWPKFFGGLTNTVTYKGFELSAFFAYQYGNKIYNHNKFFGEGGGARDAARVIFASNLARWQKPGDITDVPRPDGINVNNYRDGGSRWLEDGSFIRLRSLNIGYHLPKAIAKRIGAEAAKVFVNGTNLWLLTNYTGLDPESSASSDQNAQGIDLGTPPQPRSFQVGINLTF